jgi:hypothetical protein
VGFIFSVVWDLVVPRLRIGNCPTLIFYNNSTAGQSRTKQTSKKMKKKSLLLTAVATLGLTAATMAQSVPSYVPTNGLVGWWSFNGNANDESGNGNNGTVNGAALTTDRNGVANTAYSFDGNSDYIDCGNSSSVNLNGDLTISAWIYANNFNTDHGIVSKSGLYDFITNSPFSQPPLDKLRFEADNAPFLFSNSIQSNQWLHAVAVYSTTLGKSIYLNGTLFASNTQVGTVTPNTTYNLYLGAHQPFAVNNWSWDGKLDDIGIWNRALTQQEISNLYNGCQLTVNSQPTNQTVNINNNAQFVISSSDPNATYQWQTDLGVGYQNLNSVGQYNGTTTNTFTVSNVTMSNNNQPFRCIVTSGSCTDTSNVAVLTVNTNVGINEALRDNLFSVFPNPTQNIINVKTDSKLIGSIYSIFDNKGRIVQTGKISSENTTIELGHLTSGIYMFSVGENMKQSFKVIKE